MGYSAKPRWQEFLHPSSDSGSFRACHGFRHVSRRMLASSDGKPLLRNGAYGRCSPATVHASRVSLWWVPTSSISPAGRHGSRLNSTEASTLTRAKLTSRDRRFLRAWVGRSFVSGTAKSKTIPTAWPRRFSSKSLHVSAQPTPIVAAGPSPGRTQEQPRSSLFPGRGERGDLVRASNRCQRLGAMP